MSGGVMGAVEDTRKILQDFLAPELREIKVRLDVLEKRLEGVDQKIDKVGASLDQKIDKVVSSLNSKIDLVGSSLDQKIDTVGSSLDQKIDKVGASLNGKIDLVGDGLGGRINKLDEKLDLLDRRSEQRHDVVMIALGRLVDYNEVRERLARLEGQRPPQ